MLKLWRILGILLVAIAVIGIGICIFQEGKNQLLLSVGLLCNSLAFLIYCITARRKK